MSDDVAPTSVQRQGCKITKMTAIQTPKQADYPLDSEWPEHSMRMMTEPIAPRPMCALAIGRENGSVAVFHEMTGTVVELYQPHTTDSKLYNTYFLRQNDYYTCVGSSQKLDPLFEALAYIPEYRELSEARRIIADDTGMDAV